MESMGEISALVTKEGGKPQRASGTRYRVGTRRGRKRSQQNLPTGIKYVTFLFDKS